MAVARASESEGIELTIAVFQPSGAAGRLGSPGTYGWSRAFDTHFRIDPKEQIVHAIFQQQSPSNDQESTYGFQNLVMSAVQD